MIWNRVRKHAGDIQELDQKDKGKTKQEMFCIFSKM